MGELSMVSPVAILAQGDTHWVQEGTNFVFVVSQFMVVWCDLITQPSRLVYVCATLVSLFLFSILPKNLGPNCHLVWDLVACKRSAARRHEVIVQCSLFDVEHDERNAPLVQTMTCFGTASKRLTVIGPLSPASCCR